MLRMKKPMLVIGVNVGHWPELPAVERQTALLKGWPVIRFMEWQRTNVTVNAQRRFGALDELPQAWQKWQYERGPWADFDGVPLGVCLDVANRVGARPWVCAPHSFDEAALVEFVQFVVAHSRRRPVIEFSNELWNGRFWQRADLGGWPAVLEAQAWGTVILHRAARGRADVVLSAQAANVWIAEQLVARCSNYDALAYDALAIAPYFFPGQVDKALANVAAHRKLAARVGRPLWCYEAGHHDETAQAAENSGSPQRLAEIRSYVHGLAENGVGLACWYNIASAHRPRYAWGLHKIENNGAVVETAALKLVTGGK